MIRETLCAALAACLLGAPAAHAQDAAWAAARAELLLHPPEPLAPGGRRKPDPVGIYDLQRLEAEFEVPRGLTPAVARYQVALVLREGADSLDLQAQGYIPLQVTVDAEPVRFAFFPDADLLQIPLGARREAGAPVVLNILAQLAPLCDEAPLCGLGGPYRHLAGLTWFPSAYDPPYGDRQIVQLTLITQAGERAIATGALISEAPLGADRVTTTFETELPTLRPAFAVGETGRLTSTLFDRIELDLRPPLGEGEDGVMRRTATDVLALYRRLYGLFPFSRLGLTTINDDSLAALGPQALILLPEFLWLIPDGDPSFSLVQSVVAHEIAHQYFFNAVAISDEEDVWLSEGWAELGAQRFMEEITGTDDHFRMNYWGYVHGIRQGQDQPLYSAGLQDNPLYFEIAYQKGAATLELIRRRLSAEIFDEAMLAYVAEFTDQVATSQEVLDFWLTFTGDEVLAQLFEMWVFEAGFPTLIVSVTPARTEADPLQVQISQQGALYRGPLPIALRLAGGEPQPLTLTLDGPTTESSFVSPDLSGLEIDPDLTLFRLIRPGQPGDVNLDGLVDGRDLLDVLAAQGRASPTPSWREIVDVNADLIVDAPDAAEIIDRFGSGW